MDYLLGNEQKEKPLVNNDEELTEYLEELKNRKEMRMLFLRNGYKVDWGAVTVDELLQAMVESVYETARLEDVLNRCLQKDE